jgi:hypothetical protein
MNSKITLKKNSFDSILSFDFNLEHLKHLLHKKKFNSTKDYQKHSYFFKKIIEKSIDDKNILATH